MANTHRPLHEIAAEIKADWKNINYAAKPYVEAMATLNDIKDNYYLDTADSVVRYFLCNAGTWRGEVAKRVKAELNKIIK